MKHSVTAAVFGLLVGVFPLAALEITASAQTSTFAFDDSGALDATAPLYGMAFAVTEQLQEQMEGKISYETDPVNGNTLAARASFRTSFLEISAGPSFGVLNSGGDSEDIPVLFQPGVGIGFSITVPGLVVARADTEFALPPASVSGGQVYLQKSALSAGFYLPNVLCSAGIQQRMNTRASLTESRIKSITDYGFYTESFRKGSVFRISVNFIYRVADYFIEADSADNKKIANLLLGGGLTWAPVADFSLFVDGNGSLYSFSLADEVAGLEKLFFDLRVGATIRTGKQPAVKQQ